MPLTRVDCVSERKNKLYEAKRMEEEVKKRVLLNFELLKQTVQRKIRMYEEKVEKSGIEEDTGERCKANSEHKSW